MQDFADTNLHAVERCAGAGFSKAADALGVAKTTISGQIQTLEARLGMAGREGYLTWRRDLSGFHARRLAEIMTAQG